MLKLVLFLVLSLFLSLQSIAFGSFFSMDQKPKESKSDKQASSIVEEIPVFDSTDRLIQKRKEEAHKLITEGRGLIKKGEKKKDQTLITRGQIKKEIGEKQLKLLKEQAAIKKNEDKSDGW